MLHLSSQPNPVLSQNKQDTTNHIVEDQWTERSKGCHTCRASWIQPINMCMRGEIAWLPAGITCSLIPIGTLTFTISIQGGLMRFIALFCFGGGGGWAIKSSGHTHKCSTSFTHSFHPQVKLPMFQQISEVHESQHTPTVPLGSWLIPGMFMVNALVKAKLLIFIDRNTSDFRPLLGFNYIYRRLGRFGLVRLF